MDSTECKVRAKEWNKLVQDYIDSGVDKRPIEHIIRSCMIGMYFKVNNIDLLF